jgi:hypothetical protein
MFKFRRRKVGFPSIMGNADATSRSEIETMRACVVQAFQSLDELEKQIKLVELNLDSDPTEGRSLLRPCAQLEIKLQDLQGRLAGFMGKLNRLG